jgi:hypothetical protein
VWPPGRGSGFTPPPDAVVGSPSEARFLEGGWPLVARSALLRCAGRGLIIIELDGQLYGLDPAAPEIGSQPVPVDLRRRYTSPGLDPPRSTAVPEATRREVFLAVQACGADGWGTKACRGRASVRFGLAVHTVFRIEREGLYERWPPLTPLYRPLERMAPASFCGQR